MSQTVVGLFDRFQKAEDVIEQLQKLGVERNSISLIAKEAESQRLPSDEASATIAGAGAGAAIGGVAGLILGLAALAIPGVGPIVAAGPLAAALGSAGIGAAAGGFIGALTRMNIPEEHAQYYADAVRRGGALVVVNAADEQAGAVRDLMNRYGAEDAEQRDAETQIETRELSRTSEPQAAQMTRTGARIYIGGLEMDPRKDRFEDNSPAHRYGRSLAADPLNRDREWRDVEPGAKRDWEERNSETWSQVREAVQHGWDRAHDNP